MAALRSLLSFALTLATLWSFAQAQQSPYAGEEAREIKALSSSEVEGYLNAHGMGLAKAVELNSYPGPKHVLELADALSLTPNQVAATEEAYETMHERASALGRRIIALEAELDSLCAAQAIDSTSMVDLVLTIARHQGELRLTHMLAHLRMKTILSPVQVSRYDELRGYASVD